MKMHLQWLAKGWRRLAAAKSSRWRNAALMADARRKACGIGVALGALSSAALKSWRRLRSSRRRNESMAWLPTMAAAALAGVNKPWLKAGSCWPVIR